MNAGRASGGRRCGVALLLLCGFLLAGPQVTAATFDRRIPVSPGVRLDVRLYGGEVIVRGWRRNEVRIRATTFTTDSLEASVADGVAAVRARFRAGRPHAIDVEIDVPSWMAVTIIGPYVDVSVSDTRADVTAETVRGDVRVNGGKGTIAVKTIEGDVTLDGNEGHVVVRAANNDVRVTGLKGDLSAETVNGGVTLRGLQATSVKVTTIAGDVWWDGNGVSDRGRYRLATHTGDIDVSIPEHENATLLARAFDGRLRSTMGVKMPGGPGRTPVSIVLGTGAAQMDVQTFQGTISLRPAGGS